MSKVSQSSEKYRRTPMQNWIDSKPNIIVAEGDLGELDWFN